MSLFPNTRVERHLEVLSYLPWPTHRRRGLSRFGSTRFYMNYVLHVDNRDNVSLRQCYKLAASALFKVIEGSDKSTLCTILETFVVRDNKKVSQIFGDLAKVAREEPPQSWSGYSFGTRSCAASLLYILVT